MFYILKNATANICRLVLAAVFIFSGFVKAIDPLGVEYKIHDYLHAFGLDAMAGDGLCLFLAIALSTFEFLAGIFLLFGIKRKMMSVVTFVFVSAMTLLTLYLALKNPVSDCGCFGDAVVLTNWQTFYKNIVLLICSLVFLWHPNYVLRLISEKNQWIIALYSFVFAVSLSIYCLWHLPLLDFRPYSVGSDIRKKMEIPEDAPKPKFETTLIYEKGGQQKEFTLENYPKDDSWTFVDSKSVMVEEGFKPEISDLSFVEPSSGGDVTDDILSYEGYQFLLVAPRLEEADDGSIDLINDLYDYCQENGYPFYCATSSNVKAIMRWQDLTGAEYPFLQSDEIVLKTMVRANPGLMLLKRGVVIN
ncbi:MAG: DoxX family protein, partial [Paludibacteraceae bacterium]|nr:DoxX family protein [Paludibacteraceae bacterium]